jgi:hypothetical protein
MRLLSGLLDALHRSRQAQADAVIRRYSHLLDSRPFAEGEWKRPIARAERSASADVRTGSRLAPAPSRAIGIAVLMPALRRRAVP